MNIKLLTIDSSEYKLDEQLRKVSEEHHEVIEQRFGGRLCLARELVDLMQACKTALEVLELELEEGVYMVKGEVEIHVNEIHEKKLRRRAEQGRIKLLD